MSTEPKVEITLVVQADFGDSWRTDGYHVREFVERLVSPYMKVLEARSSIAWEETE